MILKSLKEKIRNRYNIALAEEEYTNLWQRSKLALVSVGLNRQILTSLFDKIQEQLEENGSVQLLQSSMEYF